MGSKYYVVLKGRKTGIFTEWSGEDGCNKQINGYSGAIYKSYNSMDEAEACWKNKGMVAFDNYKMEQGKAVLYVSGYYNEENRKTGYCVIFRDGRTTEFIQGIEQYPLMRGKNNGEGELDAIIKGIKLAERKGCYDILICHTYPGAYAWGVGLWDIKSNGAEEYNEAVMDAMCSVHFAMEVPSDNEYVNTAKRLAKAETL